MTQVDDTDTALQQRYETPTFDPRSAFAWTLRSGEVARLERHQRQNRRPYETLTFHPRSAFAWTLRSAEIARLEHQRLLAA